MRVVVVVVGEGGGEGRRRKWHPHTSSAIMAEEGRAMAKVAKEVVKVEMEAAETAAAEEGMGTADVVNGVRAVT